MWHAPAGTKIQVVYFTRHNPPATIEWHVLYSRWVSINSVQMNWERRVKRRCILNDATLPNVVGQHRRFTLLSQFIWTLFILLGPGSKKRKKSLIWCLFLPARQGLRSSSSSRCDFRLENWPKKWFSRSAWPTSKSCTVSLCRERFEIEGESPKSFG